MRKPLTRFLLRLYIIMGRVISFVGYIISDAIDIQKLEKRRYFVWDLPEGSEDISLRQHWPERIHLCIFGSYRAHQPVREK